MNDRNAVEGRGGGISSHNVIFNEVISLGSLFLACWEFRSGRENKKDVQKFFLNLENEIFLLHDELENQTYRHSKYTSFFVCDPKLRHIHKAEVRDRILHHALFRFIEPIFEKIFIFDSYSSRIGKGTHRAVKRLQKFAWKLSRNNTRTVWVLKCDIRKFFDSIDHEIIFNLVQKKIKDKGLLTLIGGIIDSYQTANGKGIPLGNLTSQLFSNVYLNELDQFIKRKLRIKYYVRYADDFAILSIEREYLENLIIVLNEFLAKNLKLELHPRKIKIEKLSRGIDFLGYVIFLTHIVLRTKTKNRMLRRIKIRVKELEAKIISQKTFASCLCSYLGMLTHCRGGGIKKQIKAIIN